jgi:hypothetical protein
MFVSLVNSSNIIDIDPSISVFVKLIESLSNHAFSCLIHWSSNSSNKLIVRDLTTAINIEVFEKQIVFYLGESKLVISHSFVELSHVQRLGVIIIHDLELSLKPNYTSCTSGGKLLLQSLGQLLHRFSLGHNLTWLASIWCTKNS